MHKIGLLGGTFDPVHNGHLQLGEKVLEKFNLDKIVFIPAAHPPHKNGTVVVDVEHRLEMLRLAIGDMHRLELSRIEVSRDTASYTFDTIQQLSRDSGYRAHYHFIIGYDALSEIETWYRWKDLLSTTNFIVAVRSGFSLKQILQLLERNGFSPDKGNEERWIGEQNCNEVLFLAGEIVDISSTDIRFRIASDKTWSDLVPSAVADYINLHRLYRS
ncbi:MAG: nicotinate (nicotinamide) nucleotide adenylyltransferase [Desulfofustis sp.]|nr:nicotinate (nicotinamide) nucleotide adenylyltransferase [Desulfofustis sp.]